jgi:hypothetical protein
MFIIRFYSLPDKSLEMRCQIRNGPIPNPGDQVQILDRTFLVESRVWHYQNPDPESITVNIYGRYL